MVTLFRFILTILFMTLFCVKSIVQLVSLSKKLDLNDVLTRKIETLNCRRFSVYPQNDSLI